MVASPCKEEIETGPPDTEPDSDGLAARAPARRKKSRKKKRGRKRVLRDRKSCDPRLDQDRLRMQREFWPRSGNSRTAKRRATSGRPSHKPRPPVEAHPIEALQEGKEEIEDAGDQIGSYVLSLAKRVKRSDPSTSALDKIIKAHAEGKQRRISRVINEYVARLRTSAARNFASRQRKHLESAKELRATLRKATQAIDAAMSSHDSPPGF